KESLGELRGAVAAVSDYRLQARDYLSRWMPLVALCIFLGVSVYLGRSWLQRLEIPRPALAGAIASLVLALVGYCWPAIEGDGSTAEDAQQQIAQLTREVGQPGPMILTTPSRIASIATKTPSRESRNSRGIPRRRSEAEAERSTQSQVEANANRGLALEQ